MTNVIVGRKKQINVTLSTSGNVIEPTAPVALKNIPTMISGGATRLSNLTDVDVLVEQDGWALVYDQITDKWVSKKVNLTDVDGALDGGTF